MHMTQQEIDLLIRGYSGEKLRELAADARKQPGTEWDRLLSAEMRRRGMEHKRTEEKR